MQSDLSVLGATRFAVGLSAIVRVVASDYMHSRSLKIYSGGGTLEIVPVPRALSGSSCTGWGLGYPISGGEIISADGPTVFYLAATGATMVAAMAVGLTAGATAL